MQRLNFMTYKAFITPWKITSNLTSNLSLDMSKAQKLITTLTWKENISISFKNLMH